MKLKLKRIIACLCALACIIPASQSLMMATGTENLLTPLNGSSIYVEQTSSGKYIYGIDIDYDLNNKTLRQPNIV